MVAIHTPRTPKEEIIKRLIIYFIFTIFIAWTPMIVNCIVSYYFSLSYRTLYSYTPDISFMTIILASTNIKDLSESGFSHTSLIFMVHQLLNYMNIIISLLCIGGSAVIELSNITINSSITKQFNFVIIMYILAVFLGSWIQIGGVINGKFH